MELRHFKKNVLFLCTLLISEQLVALDVTSPEKKEPATIKTAGVPAGFQFLLEKQTTAIDVFYGDVYITTTMATYSPTTVEFQNPSEVVAGLKNLITPEQIAKDLTGAIDSHAGEVCYRSSETDCGVISPNTVGVIFDEGRFRADLFINPNLLSVQQVEFNRYLPASSSGLSSINNLFLLYSGENSGGTTVGLSGQSLFSLREQRVISNWAYGNANGNSTFNIDTFYWQKDDADFQYQAGWFTGDTRFLSFMPSMDLFGFRYSTSFKARTDLSFATGTPLQLYLPSRSRVNIFKEGRFLSTGFYEPGNQTLDTSMLPDGAYNIELRIVDSAGREERVTRYYVKTQRLPPVDQDLYFIEGGDIQTRTLSGTFPQSRSTPLIQGGYSHRLTNELGLNIGGALTDNELLSEFGLYYLQNNFDLEPKLLLTTQGTYGFSFGGYARHDKLGAYYQVRRLWGDDQLPSASTDKFRLNLPSLTQYSVGIAYNVWDGNLQLNYSASQIAQEKSTNIVSLSFSRSLYYQSNQFSFTSELSKTDVDKLIMFSVAWNFTKGRSMQSLTTSALHTDSKVFDNSDLVRLSYGGSWFDDELRPEDINMQWNADVDSKNTALGFSNDIRNSYGASEFGVQFLDDQVASVYQYAGHLSTSIGGEGSDWGVGGKSGAQGALLVEVESDAETKTGYDLFVNNMNYGSIHPGQKMVVPVMPYKTYTVRLSDKNTEFVSFADKTQYATIYPGNVKSLKWQARSVGVLIGRVVRKLPGCFNDNDPKCWDPLVMARAKNVNDFAATDGDGYIQAEVFKSAKTFILTKKGKECEVDFSKLDFVEGLAYADEDLKCVDIDATDTEVEINKP